MSKKTSEHLGQLMHLCFKYACCVFLFASIKIAVCQGSTSKGRITVGTGTIIDPNARIIAEAGDIIIGNSNIIDANAVIANRFPPGAPKPSSPQVMIIGNSNIFEAYSYTESLKIGNSNIIKTKAFVGRNVELANSCIVKAGCCLTDAQIVADSSIVCGRQC